MTEGSRGPDEPIEPEIVEGPSPDGARDAARSRTFFEPASGIVILAVDWLAFGVELPADIFILPGIAVCLLAFGGTFWAVHRIQRRAGDSPGKASLKALLGGLAAGVPFPVTGTVLGTAILVLSGLHVSKKK